ncbi:hypothetical protein [Streptomyces triculaminicus]|uniref:hypothetical protein n=1 Tax=Streptomyces triculaminicus TaxID=2816232 RepID=UPI0037A2AC36
MAETAVHLCNHCREPITDGEEYVRLIRLEHLGEPMPAWHWDRPCCRAAAGTVRADTTDDEDSR